ncbi:MAG TPA: large conductance mechanosensitive channel protein MscL [Puia sp.]|jgi:large conductance mechanosensitive channel|nr:large conductance mechanosensitive channel protein MscL [Puia sp.]
MGILKEFRDFALRGNVVDLAVAVIIGAAFGAIVSSLVDNVITPLLLTPALKAANAQDLDKLQYGSVKYGLFLSSIIKFVIIAFILFLIVKGMKSMEKKKDPPAKEASSTDKLLMEIRDELKKPNPDRV